VLINETAPKVGRGDVAAGTFQCPDMLEQLKIPELGVAALLVIALEERKAHMVSFTHTIGEIRAFLLAMSSFTTTGESKLTVEEVGQKLTKSVGCT